MAKNPSLEIAQKCLIFALCSKCSCSQIYFFFPPPCFLHTGEKHKQLHSLGKLAAFHSSCLLEGTAIPVPGPSTLLEEWHVECDYKYVGHLVDIMLVDTLLWKLDNYTKWIILCMWHCMCMCACTEATKCILVSILDLPIQWVTQ